MVRKVFRYSVWMCLLILIGVSSSVMAHESTLPFFPDEWTTHRQHQHSVPARSYGNSPRRDVAVQCGKLLHQQTKVEVVEKLHSILKLPFKGLRRAQFIEFLEEYPMTEYQWNHFSSELKFKKEANDLYALWQNSQAYCFDPPFSRLSPPD